MTLPIMYYKASIMVNGLHLYAAFIQSAVQFMPLIHPFTHTFTHQRRLAAMQGTNQLVRSNWGLGVLLRDTSTRPGWGRTGNPPTTRRQLLPPEPYRPWNENTAVEKSHTFVDAVEEVLSTLYILSIIITEQTQLKSVGSGLFNCTRKTETIEL